jgi:hypothetical protein
LGGRGGQAHGLRGEKKDEFERMTMSIDPLVEKALRRQVKTGRIPECPKCGALLRVIPIPPRSDVSYVRDRVLLMCDSCGLKVVLDREG